MRKQLIAAGITLALGVGFAVDAAAQANPATLVKQRQAGMTLIAKYFGPLGGMAAGRVPYDAAVVTRNAGYLEVLAHTPWDGFAASTSGEKSAALPEVFKDTAKFKSAQEALEMNVGKLVAAAKTGNEATVKAAIGDVGKSCAACHDNFRAKQ